jgi:hypothetical protein
VQAEQRAGRFGLTIVSPMRRLLTVPLGLLVIAHAFAACGSSKNDATPPDFSNAVDCAPTILIVPDGGSLCAEAHGVCIVAAGKCSPDGLAAECPAGYEPGKLGTLACNSSEESCCVHLRDGSADAPADGPSSDTLVADVHLDAPSG